MNIQVHLYKDSDCDLCKMMLHELIDNPPKADVVINHIKDTNAFKPRIKSYPTIIIIDIDNNECLGIIEGFNSTDIINKIIEDYETKSMV